MKVRTYLILLFTALLLTQCAKDDDGPVEMPDESKVGNLLATGASASDILGNTNFTNLVIEAVYNPGFRPTAAAMANFVNFLQERTFKEDISVVYREIPSPGFNEISIQQAAELEDENRTLYNSGDTIAIYIYFSDTLAEGDDLQGGLVTLGAVYRNTSMIIYEETVKFLGSQSAQITEADVETATLMHEFAHLLGLVNLGSPQVNFHDDPLSPNHCIVDDCLMLAEIEFGQGMMGFLESRVGKGPVVPTLDAQCILDLQANGGK